VQEEDYRQLNSVKAPFTCLDSQKHFIKVTVSLNSRSVAVAAWQVNVGNVKLYLLDTHLKDNDPADRDLSARLYSGNTSSVYSKKSSWGLAVSGCYVH